MVVDEEGITGRVVVMVEDTDARRVMVAVLLLLEGTGGAKVELLLLLPLGRMNAVELPDVA